MAKDITILGIESSCDETAAAVVVNGRTVLSNEISSQIDIHTLYGGVVPEIASRKHIERINQVIRKALETAGKTLDDLDAVAVTCGPGLVGALLTGVSEAKAICLRSSYRRTYQRELYRGTGAGTTVYLPCRFRRPYASCHCQGLWRV